MLFMIYNPPTAEAENDESTNNPSMVLPTDPAEIGCLTEAQYVRNRIDLQTALVESTISRGDVVSGDHLRQFYRGNNGALIQAPFYLPGKWQVVSLSMSDAEETGQSWGLVQRVE